MYAVVNDEGWYCRRLALSLSRMVWFTGWQLSADVVFAIDQQRVLLTHCPSRAAVF